MLTEKQPKKEYEQQQQRQTGCFIIGVLLALGAN